MNRKLIFLILLTLLFADIGYSFLQHYYTPFDGDMAGGIVPASDVKPILESPLGFKVFKGETYPNPNRFFSHWTFYQYFNHVPIFLQKFTNPINSAYLSSAIAKISVQITIIFLLAVAISGKLKFTLRFLLVAVLITPLFQTNGYRIYMGIIDPSSTYIFFYALPTAILLIYFLPFFLKRYYKLELKGFKYVKLLWIPLALVSSLSGPLNPGISLAVCLLVVSQFLYSNIKNSQYNNFLDKLKNALKAIPKDYYFFLLPIFLFSIYSLFLGRYNSVDLTNKISLATLYSRLPLGIYYVFTQKIGFPILFVILTINTIFISKKFKTEEGKKILKAFIWIGLFSLIYILLLPLGGYRDYRPNVLRYDTIIPITLLLMFIFGKTTLFIFQKVSKKQKLSYIPLIILVLFIFTNADKPVFDKNECEKKAIMQIAHSKETIVRIDADCTVMSWTIIENPQDSEEKAQLLKTWRIIDEDKLFYQK